MYHFNPISDCNLFINIETQHFYSLKEKVTEVKKKRSFIDFFMKEKDKKGYKKEYINMFIGIVLMS